MNVHITSVDTERKRAATRRAFAQGMKRGTSLKFGVSSAVATGPDSRALNAPAFDLANAPAGARLVPFSELDAGQCQWGFNHGESNLFCGLPVDPAAKNSALFGRYCPCHVKAATGRTVVR